MEVLIVTTLESSLRSTIIGWSHEDADLFVPNKPIGMTPSPIPSEHPETVLEALSQGWKLLGPPVTEEIQSLAGEYFGWWLTRENQDG